MRRLILCLSVALLVLGSAAPASAAPRAFPGFRIGLGADIPLGDLLGGGLTAAPVVRLNFGRGFAMLNFAYTVTSLEEKGNEDIDPGHNFTVSLRGGYNIVGDAETHLGVGGGFGVHGFAQPDQDLGAAISIQAGVFPEAFITDGFAFTGFIGLAFEFYTDDAAAQLGAPADHTLFRFSVGQATPLVTMGFMYYF